MSLTASSETRSQRFDVEVWRRRELGVLGSLDGGRETLEEFVTRTWAPTHGVTLAPKTRKHHALLYHHHIAPTLGHLQLRAIRAEVISPVNSSHVHERASSTAPWIENVHFSSGVRGVGPADRPAEWDGDTQDG